MNVERQIIFYEHFFTDFYLEQTEKLQEKIEYVLKIIRTVQNIPKGVRTVSAKVLYSPKFVF